MKRTELDASIADICAALPHARPEDIDKLIAHYDELNRKLSHGDYLFVTPDLSGWGFIADHNNKRRALASPAELARYALALGLPVLISGELEKWEEQTAGQLARRGVTAIIDN